MIEAALRRAVSEKLGRGLVSLSGVAGGDINLAFRAELEDGRRVFIKTHPSAPPSMFAAEARGLAWLREARTLRIPEVGGANPPPPPPT
jgi:fructosamine-3-kinase